MINPLITKYINTPPADDQCELHTPPLSSSHAYTKSYMARHAMSNDASTCHPAAFRAADLFAATPKQPVSAACTSDQPFLDPFWRCLLERRDTFFFCGLSANTYPSSRNTSSRGYTSPCFISRSPRAISFSRSGK